ncbi:hypothetical protein H5410_050598 [Solanum commersonii]|uniref:Uncharacterized protein n=1 Tax=Solanum commersonii TaxID=4109 RepID=A0A9J5WVX8_SOLCO|nr:hypothetical protein H5410_050598 [Solanum commersonii]
MTQSVFFWKVLGIYRFAPPDVDLESFFIKFEKLVLNIELRVENLSLWLCSRKRGGDNPAFAESRPRSQKVNVLTITFAGDLLVCASVIMPRYFPMSVIMSRSLPASVIMSRFRAWTHVISSPFINLEARQDLKREATKRASFHSIVNTTKKAELMVLEEFGEPKRACSSCHIFGASSVGSG